MAMELRKMSIDYERRRMQLQVYFGKCLDPLCHIFIIVSVQHSIVFTLIIFLLD